MQRLPRGGAPSRRCAPHGLNAPPEPATLRPPSGVRACPSVPSRSVAGPRPAPTHAARRQFPKEHACRASPTAESPLSAGRMYRNQPVMRLDRCAYTNGSPSSTQRLPPLAHMRGSACARTPSCRRLTIRPPCCLRRCVLNELRASLHAGPRSYGSQEAELPQLPKAFHLAAAKFSRPPSRAAAESREKPTAWLTHGTQIDTPDSSSLLCRALGLVRWQALAGACGRRLHHAASNFIHLHRERSRHRRLPDHTGNTCPSGRCHYGTFH